MLKHIFYTRCFSVLAGFLFAASANANFIVNGGFEDNNVNTNNWNYFTSANVNGWDGDNIEIWDHYAGVVAPEGDQHAELNAHPFDGSVFSIFQSFATVSGQTYDVSFFYSARENENENFSFSVGPLSALLNDHVVGSWKQYTNSFVANSNLSTITFTTLEAGTLGNFLDGVVVTAKASVNEASSLMMLLIGLGSLMFIRRKSAV